MPRPQQFDRDDVLDCALKVFWQKGFEGASIQDLVEATGLNRGSLYNAFGDKAGLFAEVMERYRAASPALPLVKAAQDTRSQADVYELLAVFFKDLVSRAKADHEHKGCLLTNTSAGLYGCSTTMESWVKDSLDGLESTITVLIKRGQKCGQITQDAKATALSRFLVASAQGLNVMARTGATPKALQDIADQTLRSIKP